MTTLEVFATLRPVFLVLYAMCVAYLIFAVFPLVNKYFETKEKVGFYLCLSGFLFIKLFHLTHYTLLTKHAMTMIK